MSYNSGSNRARNFKSVSCFALVRFWNYSCDYSLNCTPVGPVTITVEPRFNESLFNEVLNITNDILCPGQSCSKMYGIEPRYNERRYNEFFDITNTIQKSKRKIYLDIMNYNVNTRQKINVNCGWFPFSSIYNFFLKFCCAQNATCVSRNWRNSWLSLLNKKISHLQTPYVRNFLFNV